MNVAAARVIAAYRDRSVNYGTVAAVRSPADTSWVSVAAALAALNAEPVPVDADDLIADRMAEVGRQP